LVFFQVKSDEVEGETLKYLNRLSDFLFTLARHAAKIDGKAENIYVRPGWLK
jgi:cob(I)alamin adenosyltransferase